MSMTTITARTHDIRLIFTTEHDDQAKVIRAYSPYAAPIERPIDQDFTLWAAHVRVAREYAALLYEHFDFLLSLRPDAVMYPRATAWSRTPGDTRVLWVRVVPLRDDEDEEEAHHDPDHRHNSLP